MNLTGANPRRDVPDGVQILTLHMGPQAVYVREANKKRMAVDIARAINEREAKRDAMRQRTLLRVIK